MAQHYLQTKAARGLSIFEIGSWSEDQCYERFKAVRFEDAGGVPSCPSCGSLDIGEIKTRRLFKCRDCAKQFSVTSGTIFASRKLSYRKLVTAIALFAYEQKGHAALKLTLELDVAYKTAFVLLHKLREAFGIEQDQRDLTGRVEVDGAWYGNHVRKYNNRSKKHNAVSRKRMKDRERCMTIIRQDGGVTVPLVYRTEAEAVDDVISRINPSAHIYSDTATHYGRFKDVFKNAYQVDHTRCYSDWGIHCNLAESFHARVHRAEKGVHHVISGPYLLAYGREMAWREDNRRMSVADKFHHMLYAVTHTPVSRRWKGYWQRVAGSAPMAYI